MKLDLKKKSLPASQQTAMEEKSETPNGMSGRQEEPSGEMPAVLEWALGPFASLPVATELTLTVYFVYVCVYVSAYYTKTGQDIKE